MRGKTLYNSFGYWKLGYWSLFGDWNLAIGILEGPFSTGYEVLFRGLNL